MAKESKYILLSKENVKTFPVKQHLGHKFIGVEPDLVIDFYLTRPRLFIRSDLVSKLTLSKIKQKDAGYFSSKQKKLFLGFTLLQPEIIVSTTQPVEQDGLNSIDLLETSALNDKPEEIVPILKVQGHTNTIAIHTDLIRQFDHLGFRDIEYRGI